MKPTKKNIIGMAGVIGTVLGTTIMIPSVAEGKYWLSGFAGAFVICGLLLVAIALGD